MQLREALRQGQEELGQRVERADLDTLGLLAFLLGRPTSWVLAHDDVELTNVQRRRFQGLLIRRKHGWPLPYLYGFHDFFGRRYVVTPTTLIPRPATELILEYLLAHESVTPQRILDIGTGTGCIAITLATSRPAWNVRATDVSSTALKIARRNARIHRASVRFVHDRSFSNVTTFRPDLIVANLPYLTKREIIKNRLTFEPRIALDGGGRDGLQLYRRLLRTIPTSFSGSVYLEALPRQHIPLSQIIRQRWSGAMVTKIGSGRYPAGLRFLTRP